MPESNTEIKTIEIIFPGMCNHHRTLFGGEALSMMDRAAFYAATRYCRKLMVTVAVEQVRFHSPVFEGELVELIARVTHVGRTSITTEVELFSEGTVSGKRVRCATGKFVLVAVDEQGRATAVTGA